MNDKNSNPDFEALIKIAHCLRMIEKYYLRVLKIEKVIKVDSQLSDGLVFKFIQLRQEFAFLSKKILDKNKELKDQYKHLVGLRNIAAHTCTRTNTSIIQKILKVDIVSLKQQVINELLKFNATEEEVMEIIGPLDEDSS